jgi:hypothetical protein
LVHMVLSDDLLRMSLTVTCRSANSLVRRPNAHSGKQIEDSIRQPLRCGERDLSDVLDIFGRVAGSGRSSTEGFSSRRLRETPSGR